MERRAFVEDCHVGRARADVRDHDAEVHLRLGEDRLGRRERVGDPVVDADLRLLDAFGQVLQRRGRRGDDVGHHLETHGAHAERVLDTLLAIDRIPPGQDVEDLAVRRDVDGAGDLGHPLDVLACDLAVMPADRHGAGRIQALDVAAPDPDVGSTQLVAARPLGRVYGLGDRLDRLLDVDDHALLDALGRAHALADDVHRPVGSHLTDEGDNLRRAHVDRDDRLLRLFHAPSPLSQRMKWRRMSATFWKMRRPNAMRATR